MYEKPFARYIQTVQDPRPGMPPNEQEAFIITAAHVLG
jgi:hypothetical protein